MGVYSKNRSNINENFVFSTEDIYQNFDEWKKEKGKNILYVTGLSGSGKTTLGEEFEKKYNAKLFEIDGIEWNYDSTNNGILDKVKSKYPEYKRVVETEVEDLEKLGLTKKQYYHILSSACKMVIDIIRKDYNTLYIIEGIQIFQYWEGTLVNTNNPLVIKGSSVVKSIWRRWKRNGNGHVNLIKELKNEFPDLFKWYMDMEKDLTKFKKSTLKESTIYENNIDEDNLPDIMYFSSSKKINILKGRVFLSPLKGISSMFIVDKKDLILPKHRKCSFNIGYKEWKYPDSKLKNALNEVHITHNIKSINSIERGKSSGYIYTIDISKIKNKLSLFVTEDQNREVIYNGDESLKIVKVEPHSIEWTFEYDQDNADMHGYGFLNENSTILLEASVGRRWKCPYCNYHESREGLVSHVEKEHSEMLSEDYPASRVVFNYINKKDRGSCIICRKETKWNEDTWRYERLCDNPKCEKKYIDSFKKNMINKHGVVHMLNDPEQQKKMLANRRISGTYKFADGGIRSYCGTYEKKALEFYDKVMNVHSKDIMTPGPIVEYEYNGKTLKWITDIYYVPANLVHDIKDGGSNVNGRQMDDYRAKQIAKEDAISKMGKYNYIRLTDNSFDQLLLILAEIKAQMMDNVKDEYVIRINEALLLENIKGAKINEMTSTAAAMPNQNNQSDNVYIIPHMINNVFNVALSTDKYFSNIYKIKDGKIVKGSVDDLYESTYSVYKYNGNNATELCESILNDYNNGIDVESRFYLYEKVCGKRLMDESQFEYDEMLEDSIDWFTESILTTQIHEATLMHKFNKENKSQLYMEVTDIINEGVSFNQKGCKILNDIDGYFVYNESTERRTKSYDTISSIPYINIVLDKLSK